MRPEQFKVAVTTTDGLVIMSIIGTPETADVDALIAQSSSHGWTGKPVSWRLIADSDIPIDRSNRVAWEDNGRQIAVNPEKVPPPRGKSEIELLRERVAALEARRG